MARKLGEVDFENRRGRQFPDVLERGSRVGNVLIMEIRVQGILVERPLFFRNNRKDGFHLRRKRQPVFFLV